MPIPLRLREGTRVTYKWRIPRASAILASALIVLVPAARAEAAPPPPVVGVLSQTSGFVIDQQHFTADCNPTGTSTISYTITGVATGTYTGTYTEMGTFVIGPYTLQPTPTTNGGGPLLSYTGSFTLDSPDAYITGTMTGGSTPGLASCETISGSISSQLDCQVEHGSTAVREELYSAYAEAEVSAIIRTTSDGTYEADGSGSFSVHRQVTTCANGGVVDNRFSTTRMTLVVGGQIAEPPTPLPNTTGKTTGGGKVNNTATFNVTALSDANGFMGNCLVKVAGSTIRCEDVLAYNQTGNTATFSGNATLNRLPTTYKIIVQDNGEPNQGQDTFTMTTASGFSLTGSVTDGNIHVHRAQFD